MWRYHVSIDQELANNYETVRLILLVFNQVNERLLSSRTFRDHSLLLILILEYEPTIKTIATYLAKLREISEFCSHRDKLDNMLRDRIVYGINYSTMQRHLLLKAN